ncbi:MAG: efflux RND transporter permease subunit, partial [Altibacter sp.]|nr:efflux RND transporter permease subunit [Altibacter sp.]
MGSFILKNKKISSIVIVVSFLAFIFTAVFYAPKIGFEFMPHSDDGKIKVEVELPEGYNLHETAAVLSVVEDSVKTMQEVTHILTDLGKISDLNTGANMAK